MNEVHYAAYTCIVQLYMYYMYNVCTVDNYDHQIKIHAIKVVPVGRRVNRGCSLKSTCNYMYMYM